MSVRATPKSLTQAFFARDVDVVARALIGVELTFKGVGGRIVEVESYDPTEPGAKKRLHRGGSFLCTDQYCTRYMVGTRGKGEVDSEPGGTAVPAAELFHQQLVSSQARHALPGRLGGGN